MVESVVPMMRILLTLSLIHIFALHVFLGQIGVHLQVHARFHIAAGDVAAHLAHGFFNHLYIQIVAHRGHEAGLLRAQQVARAANLQIAHGHAEDVYKRQDSLREAPRGGEIVRLPAEKDDTDMVAALRLGLARGYRDFRLYGAAGGRIDHTIANLQDVYKRQAVAFSASATPPSSSDRASSRQRNVFIIHPPPAPSRAAPRGIP